ncbi:YrhK family protein [Marinomonas aquiplantarum]|uniref:YrhK-like protein n=1 Tax=Marinomonas aquiplantarum TaxID=491951 RepID=A0A366D062_9GAMM|nr:YrhK family protein [Marinomonas aquiplantarum]RBO83316.1 YrhK-like protein [Marinomonas aquiplantarum]
MSESKQVNQFDIQLGQKHLIVQRRYEAIGALNDLLIGIWFLIGSFFFLSDALVEDGTWLFILGSAQLLIKPAIKLVSLLHIGRIHPQLRSGSPFKK